MNMDGMVAIIPARGGSKRLPRKNLLPLAGRPLVAWTIQAALESTWVSRTIVTTDDEEIAAAARKAGAEVPFLRPAHLASDTADSVSVAAHVVEYLRERGEGPERIALLQPTSPLRTARDLDAAVELMERRGASAVISVCEAEHTPLAMNVLPEDGAMDGFLPESVAHRRSQDLPVHYRINGALYLIRTEFFLNERTFFPKKGAFAYVMDRTSSVDIDVEEDFVAAEALMRWRERGKGSNG